jgi:hypothetical protein
MLNVTGADGFPPPFPKGQELPPDQPSASAYAVEAQPANVPVEVADRGLADGWKGSLMSDQGEQNYDNAEEFLETADETAIPAYGAAAGAGAFLAAGGAEVAGATLVGTTAAGAAAPIALAAGAGVAVGMGIEYATDGAISDAGSDALMGLVGEEESYKAAVAFDDGQYVEGVGHMAMGAGETISEAASDAYDYTAEAASDAYDTVSETASEAYESVSDTASDAWDWVTGDDDE